jgi:hypothetical protein
MMLYCKKFVYDWKQHFGRWQFWIFFFGVPEVQKILLAQNVFGSPVIERRMAV